MPDHFADHFDPELTALKLPPLSVVAEQSVLDGLMLENTAWERVADVITDFNVLVGAQCTDSSSPFL